MGYEVEAADTAEKALELVEKFHPAVVVTDLVLPGMDGLDLLQQLKGAGRAPAVCWSPDTPRSRRRSRRCAWARTTT